MLRLTSKLGPNFRQFCTLFERAVPYVLDSKYECPLAEVNELTNGIKVVSENWKSSNCSVGLHLDIGVRYENEENNGILKYIEHMLFKGTESKNAIQIQQEILERGAEVKTSVSREMTSIVINCLNKDVDWAVNLLGDIISKPKITEESFEKQRNQVLKEYHNYVNDRKILTIDLLYATAFQHTDMQLPLFGNPETIENMKLDDLMKFRKEHFLPPKMILSVAGGVESDKVNEIAEKHLSNIPTANELVLKRESRFTASEARLHNDFEGIGHVAYAVSTPGAASPVSMHLEVAAALAGQFDITQPYIYDANFNINRLAASPEFKYLDNFFYQHTHTSLWGIYFYGNSPDLFDLPTNILQIFKGVLMETTDVLVNATVNSLITKTLADTGCMNKMNTEMAKQLIMMNYRQSPAERIELLSSIEAKHIQDVAEQCIFDREPAIAAFGAIEGVDHYQNLKRDTVPLLY